MCIDGFYPIVHLCRQDIAEKIGKENADKLSEADIEHIATKMGDAYCELGFWEDLEVIAEAMLEDK